MLDALTITEAEAAGLSELAALDLAMARDFAARAQDERDPDTANRLARSYQRAARSYRQSLALKVRLAREVARAEREARGNPEPFSPRAARRRADDLRGAVTRVAFNEYEAPEHEEELEDVLGALEEVLQDCAADPDFTRQPLDAQVGDICATLELSPDLAARWRELPDPDEASPAPQAEPARRESG
jgi:hypothetical protein